MMDKLKAKLKEIERSKKWFWKQKIKGICTYQHFMEQINENVPAQDDVKKAITDYLGEK